MVLSAREKSALEQFKSRLTQDLDGGLVELKLFGSKARGDDRPGWVCSFNCVNGLNDS